MSKKAKVAVVIGVVVLVLAGVGGWFLHSSMVKKDYDKAWTGYEDEVKAWKDVNERYQVLEPVCGELVGKVECSELKTAGEEATKVVESLSLDLKKVGKPSSEETQKLEKATQAIKTEREKFEPAVVKVEKAAEATIQDKFAPVLEEAEKKANEANGLVGSLKGKVKDENTLKALENSASELSSSCGKWKGKDIPTGQEGVQAYLELRRSMLAIDDATAKVNESHAQWQAEEDRAHFKNMVATYSAVLDNPEQYITWGTWDDTRFKYNLFDVDGDGFPELILGGYHPEDEIRFNKSFIVFSTTDNGAKLVAPTSLNQLMSDGYLYGGSADYSLCFSPSENAFYEITSEKPEWNGFVEKKFFKGEVLQNAHVGDFGPNGDSRVFLPSDCVEKGISWKEYTPISDRSRLEGLASRSQ